MPITDEHFKNVLKFTLENNGTIVDIARNLGVPVIEILPYLQYLVKQNEKFATIIKEKNWPLDIDIGFIYVGGVPLLSPQGERIGLLKPGMHVLAKKLPRKSKAQKYDYYMIYWPARILYRKYLKFKLIKDEHGEIIGGDFLKDKRNNIKYEWLQDDIDHLEYKQSLAKTGVFLQETESTKIVMVPDREIGQVNDTMIVNIKYDWT